MAGQTEYLASGRFLSTGLGLQNPTSSIEAIHEISQQGRVFAYPSTPLDPTTRFVTTTGVGENRYQIPNNPGQPVNAGGFNSPDGTPNSYSAFGFTNFETPTNQNQYEKNAYGWRRGSTRPATSTGSSPIFAVQRSALRSRSGQRSLGQQCRVGRLPQHVLQRRVRRAAGALALAVSPQ